MINRTYIPHLQLYPICVIPTTVGILCSMRNKFLLDPGTQVWFQSADWISNVCIAC